MVAGAIVLSLANIVAAESQEVRALLSEHLRNPEFSLDHKAEYVVTDPAFIELVIDQALKYIDVSKPLSATQLTQAKASAVTYYRLGLAKPDGLKALEARIAERFAHPLVTVRPSAGSPSAQAVELDFGWMIGPLAADTRYGIVISATGENFEGRAPATKLLAKLLTEATRAHPKAERISLRITFPRARMGRDLRVTYVRAGFPQTRNGWVLLESVTAPTTLALYQVRVNNEDFSPYRDGRYSFYVDCAPKAGTVRVPQAAAPTAAQRTQCLTC